MINLKTVEVNWYQNTEKRKRRPAPLVLRVLQVIGTASYDYH